MLIFKTTQIDKFSCSDDFSLPPNLCRSRNVQLLGSIDKSLDSLDESRPGQSVAPSNYQAAAAQQGNDNCCVIS